MHGSWKSREGARGSLEFWPNSFCVLLHFMTTSPRPAPPPPAPGPLGYLFKTSQIKMWKPCIIYNCKTFWECSNLVFPQLSSQSFSRARLAWNVFSNSSNLKRKDNFNFQLILCIIKVVFYLLVSILSSFFFSKIAKWQI
jgi:hypothetical protein